MALKCCYTPIFRHADAKYSWLRKGQAELCGNSEPADVIEDTPNYNQKFWNSSWLMVKIMVQIMTDEQPKFHGSSDL